MSCHETRLDEAVRDIARLEHIVEQLLSFHGKKICGRCCGSGRGYMYGYLTTCENKNCDEGLVNDARSA